MAKSASFLFGYQDALKAIKVSQIPQRGMTTIRTSYLTKKLRCGYVYQQIVRL